METVVGNRDEAWRVDERKRYGSGGEELTGKYSVGNFSLRWKWFSDIDPNTICRDVEQGGQSATHISYD